MSRRVKRAEPSDGECPGHGPRKKGSQSPRGKNHQVHEKRVASLVFG